jgi:acyl-CoA reductase-like NAD-dependent aldehyde dehydrogenase
VKESQTNGSGRHLNVIRGDAGDSFGRAPRGAAADGPVTLETIRAKVDDARAAQRVWARKPLAERVRVLKRAAQEILRRRDEVIAIAEREIGKVTAEGIFNETLGALDQVGGWSSVLRRHSTRRTVRLNPISFPRKSATVAYLPRGVVGVIAPWNYPVAGPSRAVIPALLTGNGVVLKPSEYTPRTSAWLIERLSVELPPGLASVVQGDGSVGQMLVDAGIDACVFTGSARTGAKVRVQCAERGIPSSVEMGGKDPAIVLSDCDLPRTIAAITQWTLSNAGQACGAIEIAYVDKAIADALVQRLAAAWSKLAVGGSRASVAALGNERQLGVVVDQVADARAKGATVVCGGERTGEGLGYRPTILDHCTDQMAVVTDETFGPVLAVVRVDGAEEAIRRTNEGRYGLGASIWTSDVPRAQRIAERLEVGVVTINDHAFSGAIASLPWSGTRETGFGVANGPESLATFVRPRAVVVDGSHGPEPYWMPYDETLIELGGLLMDAQVGKIGRAWKLPLLLRKRMNTIRAFFDWK